MNAFDDAVRYVHDHLPLRGFAPESFTSFYAERQRHSYRDVIDTITRLLPPGATILDFGAGMCDKSVVAQQCGYRVTAYDDFRNPLSLDEQYRARVFDFAKTAGVEVRVAETNAFPFASESFDMVMAHAVIEHLHDSPRELLNDAVELLKPGGLLFITVPSAVNIRKRIDVLFGRTNLPRFDTFYWYPGPWRGHVREYTKGDLAMLGRFLGLEQIELRASHHMLSVVPRRLRPFYLAATAIVPGWRDSWSYVGRKPQGWKSQRDVPPHILDSILTHLNR